MHEKLAKALDYISDRHIAEAAGAKGQRRYWLCAVAAVLAVVLLISLLRLFFASPAFRSVFHLNTNIFTAYHTCAAAVTILNSIC